MTQQVENRVIGFLGLCMRAGRIISGQEACVDLIRRGEAALVLLDGRRILVLDRDELDEALEQKEITEEEYRQTVKEGEKLYRFLQENGKAFLQFCSEWRERLLIC